MQRRLLISTLVVAVVAVLLLGVPLAFDLSRLRTGQASQELRHEASYIATGLQDRYDAGLPADASQAASAQDDLGEIRHQELHGHRGGRQLVRQRPGHQRAAHDRLAGSWGYRGG